MRASKQLNNSGFTLLEIIIVITLMMGLMVYALPNINTSVDYITKLNTLASTIKSAFDTAVLTGRSYRLVVELDSGDYWLEETPEKNFKISTDQTGLDLNIEQAKQKKEDFEIEFEEYVELAGNTFTDIESGDEIKPDSPVLKAKRKLIDPVWNVVTSIEWSKKSLGPELGISLVQAEHHGNPIKAGEEEEGTQAHIYISPTGYLEKAYIVIVPLDPEGFPEEDVEPFTVETFPYEGIARVTDGMKEMNFERD